MLLWLLQLHHAQGLVAWLDTRDADPPALTPRDRLGSQSLSPAARHGSSCCADATYCSASPLSVNSLQQPPGPAAAAAVGKSISETMSSPLDGLLDDGNTLPPQQFQAKLAAAVAAGLADRAHKDRHHAVDGVAQLKLSPRDGVVPGGRNEPAVSMGWPVKVVAASPACESQQGDVHWEKDA